MGRRKKLVFGWNPSELDGTEHVLDYESNGEYENLPLPTEFSYKEMIPDVLNQGNTSTCVPHSVSSILDWYDSLKAGEPTSHNMSIYNIYDRKDNEGDGMTFKCALSTLKKIGAVTSADYKKGDYSNAIKIKEYAMVRNLTSLKYSVLLNGPCLIATMVRDINSMEYWNGYQYFGGHAVSCIGWNEEGLIIRNSWGKAWGNDGYTLMKYKDFNVILEAWTAIF